ncbi:MAG: tRNA pseudouridine(13) synthase TruD [Phycisphaerales bacterium]
MRHPTESTPGVFAGYLTDDLPAIGGVIRAHLTDFLVDEQPLYHPSGEGEHIYLYIEKRGRTTAQAAEIIAKHFGVERSAIGYAGMKDAHAATRQVFSVHTPGRSFDDFPDLEHADLSVLWADMHTNKLRLGHLKGNRFSIRIRGVRAVDSRAAWAALERMERQGVPNFFGDQRFGGRAANHVIGRCEILRDAQAYLDVLLGPDDNEPDARTAAARAAYARGDFDAALQAMPRDFAPESAALRALARGDTPARAVRAIGTKDRAFYATAFQSFIFNRVLSRRLDSGTLGDILPGDLAWKHDNGAVFAVDEQTASDSSTSGRAAALEISPSGPLWGAKMTRASGETDRAEVAALEDAGVTLGHLESWSSSTRHALPGARRPLRVLLLDPDCEGGVDEHGEYVRVAFELPAGSFATAVLREIMKPERAAAVTRS